MELSGRTPLEGAYPDLRDFFVKKLGVMVMSANVLAKELVKTWKARDCRAGPIKRLMLNLGQLLSDKDGQVVSNENLQALRETCRLPVKKSGGFRFFPFFIIDHERYGNAFYDKIPLVDFTFSQLTILHPLFSALNLENRYLSNHVEKRTSVNSSSKDDVLTDHFRRRAFALSCCANYHHSPQYSNKSTQVHQLLCNAELFMCDGIWTDLVVKTAKGENRVRSDRALVKVEQTDHSLTISVPRDLNELNSCYRTELPSQICRILGLEKDKARESLKQVYRILNDEKVTLEDIMKEEDIPSYDWFEKPEVSATVRGPGLATTLASEPPETLQPATQEVVVRSRQEAFSPQETPTTLTPPTTSQVSRFGAASTLPRATTDRSYLRLLQSITRQARRSPEAGAGPGSSDNLSLATLDDALDDLATEQQYFGDAHDHGNNKIGAAGELFVFERLKALGLPEFGVDKWQSRIRGHVSVLTDPEYASLKDWPHPEVADIMYTDSTGQVESLLQRVSKY